MYLNLSKMTESQHHTIFIKKEISEKTVEFRRKCQEQVAKVEKIISKIKVFDRDLIKRLYFEKEIENKSPEISLRLEDLFTLYIIENDHLSFRTKKHMNESKNVFIRDKKDLTILEITPEFLKKNEIKRSKNGVSISAINSNFRDLRTVINYFSNRNKIIPDSYIYPFGKSGYSICEYFPKKQVLSNDEITRIIELKEFENSDQEFARDIWELLYRCNGINFADLMRLRWDNRNGNCFVIFRKKTENTRKKLKQEIVIPINDRIQKLIDKVGKPNSSFILGFLKDDYTEKNYDYMHRKVKGKINKSLKEISEKLNLSITLQLKTARDSYATVLSRSGVSIDKISEMLSHSNTVVTKHYIGSMDMETAFSVNENLI
ncbi:tyrosine-type recombinase/integrase [Chryseobacterium scophthalmum]|uniref:tyrosine-type recombinase/integrase n=1 Tax=Chryseobacterium scophthalmum TaxID=59733 RepID=UPI001F1B7C84|nr:tyrosine-type recombinase/integrase [Chryseobacterium scophthalmum]